MILILHFFPGILLNLKFYCIYRKFSILPKIKKCVYHKNGNIKGQNKQKTSLKHTVLINTLKYIYTYANSG